MLKTICLAVFLATLGFVSVWFFVPEFEQEFWTREQAKASVDVMLVKNSESVNVMPASATTSTWTEEISTMQAARDRASNAVRSPDGYCRFEFAGHASLIPTCKGMQRKAASAMRDFYDDVIREPDATMVLAAGMGIDCESMFTRARMTDWDLTRVCLGEAMKELELSLLE